ncbi:hypothetical protein C1O66_15785 [Paucibacter aquatile]|uniref:Uncharacterized protein n=2 Tax=Kinneretia aquatilis TaxID=2070761 RepID=A0A2N8KZL3_9BURK|nr:hypothetical protein C1O66_15785 [Paucibacter aquatile]
MTACSSMQLTPITKEMPETQRPALAVNDQVTVVLNSGEQLKLQVTATDKDALSGRLDASGEIHRVPWSEMRQVEHRVSEPIKTTLLAVTIYVVLGVALANSVARGVAKSLGL